MTNFGLFLQDLFLKMIPESSHSDYTKKALRRTGFRTAQDHIHASFVTHPSPWQAYILKFSSGLRMTKRLKQSRFGYIDLEWIPGRKPRALT